MLHRLSPFFVAQPPFRPPDLRIISKGGFVPMDNPSVDTHNRTRRKHLPTYLRAFRWNHPFQGQPERRVNSSSFLHARIQVWKIDGLLPSYRIRKAIFACSLLQLSQQTLKGLWIL